MWNRFSLKIKLIIFMTLVVTVVEISTLYIISNIEKTQSQNNAISDINNIVKSLNNDLLKTLLSPNTDSLSNISFRLSAFDKINGIILYNKNNKTVYSYGKIANLQKQKNNILKNKYILSHTNIYIK